MKARTEDTVIPCFRAIRAPEVRKYLPQKATAETEAPADFEKTGQPASTSFGRTIYAEGNHIGGCLVLLYFR